MNHDKLHSELNEQLRLLDQLLKELAELEKSKETDAAQRKGELLTNIELLRIAIMRTEAAITLAEARWERRQDEFTHQKQMHWWSRSIASIFVAGALWIGYRETSHPPTPPPPLPHSQTEHGNIPPHYPDDVRDNPETMPKEGKPKPANTNVLDAPREGANAPRS